MKILVVCQYYYPEDFQITTICEQLVADGYEVTVLTGRPNYPTGIVPEEYKKGHRDEYINGVHVIRCFEIGRKQGVLHLGLNYISFLRSALRRVAKMDNEFDLVFVYQLSPVLMGLPGRKYVRKYHVPMFLYCCDLWPESMKIYIRSEKSLIFRFAREASHRVYSACNKIAVQSKSFIKYMETEHSISLDKLVYIPAFANEDYLNMDFSDNNDTIDFVFLGNIGIAQNLSEVIAAVEMIKDVKGFKLHIVGDGSCLNSLKSLVHQKGLEEIVQFYGRRPVEDMPQFYKLADACLVSLKADNLTGLTLPSKMQGYMAAGKLIIGMIDGSANEVINESGCGICVSSNDTTGLAAAMIDFIQNSDKYKNCGNAGREYFIMNFRFSGFMEKLENEFEKLRDEDHVAVCK